MSHYCVLAFIVVAFFCTTVQSHALTDTPNCPDPRCCEPVTGNQTRSCAIATLSCGWECWATCSNGYIWKCVTLYITRIACQYGTPLTGETACSSVDRGCEVEPYPSVCAECPQEYIDSQCAIFTGGSY